MTNGCISSERILEKMNKRIPFDRIEETFSNCRKAGVIAIASFIVGFPDETVEDVAGKLGKINCPDFDKTLNKIEDDVHSISGRLIMIPIVK